MATLTLDRVGKTYRGGVDAVKSVSFEVADGEFVSLVGPSGCGKSTTLSLIAGLEEPSRGSIRIDGQEVNALSPRERDIAMVFQSYALYPHMDVRRNLAFPLELSRMPPGAIAERVAHTAALLGLEPLLSRRPRELSGGQRQRVALGRALVRRPKLFLFDEPLSNLDAALRTQMRGELKRLHAALRGTFIYVTHDQAEAMTLSDRVVVMSAGLVQQVAAPRELYGAPANSFVAGFFGSPRINLVRPAALGLPDEPGVQVGIRPEHVKVGLGEQAPPGAVRGTVFLVEPMGPESWVTVEVSGEQVVARAEAELFATPGAPAWVSADASRLHRFDAATGERLSTP
jgi:multiple sugar transport system ATP-binding protein